MHGIEIEIVTRMMNRIGGDEESERIEMKIGTEIEIITEKDIIREILMYEWDIRNETPTIKGDEVKVEAEVGAQGVQIGYQVGIAAEIRVVSMIKAKLAR